MYHEIISLQSFTVFSEYFIALSIVYILIVVTLITYNSYGLMLQKSISECIALVLIMSCYLLINDDLIASEVLFSYCYNSSIINDDFALFTKVTICFFSAMFFLLIADSLKEQKLTSFEYLIIILFAILGLLLMCSSNDLLIAYLSIELSSLAFYVLASFRKISSHSVESGIKYFITGAVSSAFFLLGSSFIYGVSGTINFSELQSLFSTTWTYELSLRFLPLDNTSSWSIAYHVLCQWLNRLNYFDYTKRIDHYQIPLGEVGLILILFSLFIKLALAPFHLWSLDVYEGSPTASTFFFAVISKLSVFVILTRLCYTSFSLYYSTLQFYCMWVGLLSIFVGSFGGLTQRKLKTLLAYSSISHMGYILLAFSVIHFFRH